MKFRFLTMILLAGGLAACGGGDGDKGGEDSGDETTGADSAQTTGPSKPHATVNMGDLKIAYIKSDSVIFNYEGFKKSNAELSEVETKIRQEVEGQKRVFERKAAAFQQKIESGMYIQSEAEKEQQDLLRMQQNLENFIMKKEQEFMEMQNRVQTKQSEKLTDFITRYAEEHEFDFMFQSNAGGSALIYGKEAYNVSKDVLTKLNEEYAAGEAGDMAIDVSDTLDVQ